MFSLPDEKCPHLLTDIQTGERHGQRNRVRRRLSFHRPQALTIAASTMYE
jgi:hypothetical protein